jgi:DNA (cytosine-5)-methyltransferase 1
LPSAGRRIISKTMNFIPAIDLFAGPGGLNEGFSRFASWYGSDIRFKSVLSIEKDAAAAKTLTLRAFFRQFNEDALPSEYWSVLRGEATPEILHDYPEWAAAADEVWQAELGRVPLDELHTRIAAKLEDRRDWLLLGGPPCQAYSIVGRSRMTGIGFDARTNAKLDPRISETVRRARLKKFGGDVRHTLYREYLRIIAVHQPAVFVMENVRGILSALVPGDDGLMFDRIRADLEDPWRALADDPDHRALAKLARSSRPRYRLFAFADPAAADLWADGPDNRDFLIQSEEYGIPQKRHRVIVLGIRDDVDGLPGRLGPSGPATVRDAIGHLPALRSGLSDAKDDFDEWARVRTDAVRELKKIVRDKAVIAALGQAVSEHAPLTRGSKFVAVKQRKPQTTLERWLRPLRTNGYAQHETRSHMMSDVVRYVYAACAAVALNRTPKLEHWPKELLPEHRNVQHDDRTGTREVGGFSDRFKVQRWEEPSSTITSHIAKDGHYFIHPDPSQARSLTVREAARLQTFPDDYFFCGNRTEAYGQVGNAVPPYLAVQLASVVAPIFEALTGQATETSSRAPSKRGLTRVG